MIDLALLYHQVLFKFTQTWFCSDLKTLKENFTEYIIHPLTKGMKIKGGGGNISLYQASKFPQSI